MNDDRILKFVTPFGFKHPRFVARVRFCVGIWLLLLTAFVYANGLSGWWGVLLVTAAATCFYLAYREPRAIRARANSTRRM